MIVLLIMLMMCRWTTRRDWSTSVIWRRNPPSRWFLSSTFCSLVINTNTIVITTAIIITNTKFIIITSAGISWAGEFFFFKWSPQIVILDPHHHSHHHQDYHHDHLHDGRFLTYLSALWKTCLPESTQGARWRGKKRCFCRWGSSSSSSSSSSPSSS